MKLLLLFTSIVALAQTPALRKGISVEMAVTTSAVPMREADEAGSLIVAVTRSGQLYLEAEPVAPAAITAQARAGAKLFVKADTRASYAGVAVALTALRAAGVDGVSLLTSQRDPVDGRDTPPKGVRVSFGAPRESGQKAVGLEFAGPMLFGDVVRIIDAAGTAVFLR
jgi:biopolymer transport protein ExbD